MGLKPVLHPTRTTDVLVNVQSILLRKAQLALSVSMAQDATLQYRFTRTDLGDWAPLVQEREQVRMHHVQGSERFSLGDDARDADLARTYMYISTTSSNVSCVRTANPERSFRY